MSKNRVWHSSFVLLWVVRLRRHGTDFTKAKLVVCLLFRTPMPSFCSLSAVALKLALLRIAPGEIKDFHVAIVVLNRQSSSLCRLSHRLALSACAIKDCFAHYAFASLATAVIKGLRACCLLFAASSALRTNILKGSCGARALPCAPTSPS